MIVSLSDEKNLNAEVNSKLNLIADKINGIATNEMIKKRVCLVVYFFIKFKCINILAV